ncbi:MAG: D-glycero-beta-D-manno-heptose 1-phosphate adenylyltransferase [Candidatus Margulisiibacteriota bacterium]
MSIDKIISREESVKLIKSFKDTGKKIVFTNGCFDLLHVGHIRYLQEAKKIGDILVIGLNSDRSVRQLKGPSRPIVQEDDRAEILAAFEMVDYVTIFDEDTPIETIKLLKPDIQVKGGDYKKDDLPETPVVEAYGGKVVILPFVEGKSTTDIEEKIIETRNSK